MNLDILNKVSIGYTPLCNLKVGDKYQIQDSQCIAKIKDMQFMLWSGFDNSQHIQVEYEAYLPGNKHIHEGRFIRVYNHINTMVKVVL